MVIDDLDIPRRAVAPREADAELIVDADTPLPGAIAGKLLQPVLRRHRKVSIRVEACTICSFRIATVAILANRATRAPSNKASVSRHLKVLITTVLY